MNSDELVEKVFQKYVGSGDFNGLGLVGLKDTPTNREVLRHLVERRRVDIVRGDAHPNPHIKAFAEDKVDDQLRKLNEHGVGHGCLYPTRTLLRERSAGDAFADRPFSKELAEGAGQLEYRAFDLRMLEFYRNDPRFEYRVDDVMGNIYRRAEHREDSPATVSDGIELARFGFAYDDNMTRAVALFLRDLHNFESEQQRYMSGFLLPGIYRLHPGFYQSAILGEWPERISIYDGFLEEKKHINAMCGMMGRPPLFKTTPNDERPHAFSILLRPTKKEYRDFVLQLNSLLTDDINVAFFEDDIPTTERLTREDGTSITSRIGTITLLQRWLEKYFHPSDPDELSATFKSLRELRDLRAKPAHMVEDNAFDQQFLHQQRELIQDAFGVVRTLRMILENHPAVTGYEVPQYLREAKVWSM